MSDLVAAFAAETRAAPQRTLIHLPGLRTTMRASDIQAQHEQLADRLSRMGLRAGDLVVSGVGNRPESIALLLACRSLDVALMPVDAGATPNELEQLVVRFGARALLTVTAPQEQPGTVPLLDTVSYTESTGQRQAYAGIAVLKLTSGSTGFPKAVLTTEDQLIADGGQIMTTMGIAPEETQIAAIPLSHSYGLAVLVLPLLLQGTAIVLRESFVPQQMPDDAEACAARRLPGVPFMFEYFIEHPPGGGWPARLDRLISAGARLTPSAARGFFDRFGVKIHGFYGTTETGGICYDASDDVDVGDRVGHPLSGVSLSLMPDEGDAPETGRVHVRSPAVGRGYSGMEQGDFIEGGFLTGDIGMIDDRGLALKGRVSSFINVAGRKVQPDEVDAVLRLMPGIRDSRVMGASDPRRGQQVAACVVPADPRQPPSVVDIRQFCAQRLAPHKIPRLIVFVDAIPVTPRGKTDRAALEHLVRAHLDGRP